MEIFLPIFVGKEIIRPLSLNTSSIFLPRILDLVFKNNDSMFFVTSTQKNRQINKKLAFPTAEKSKRNHFY